MQRKRMYLPGHSNPADTIEFDFLPASIPHSYRYGNEVVPQADPEAANGVPSGYPDDLNELPESFSDYEY